MHRFGEIYRAVRHEFGDQIEITMLDPRNFVAYLPLVIRDAFRFKVPARTTLQALSAHKLFMGILDGQVLFSGRIPTPDEAVMLISDRLEVHRVGAA